MTILKELYLYSLIEGSGNSVHGAICDGIVSVVRQLNPQQHMKTQKGANSGATGVNGNFVRGLFFPSELKSNVLAVLGNGDNCITAKKVDQFHTANQIMKLLNTTLFWH